MRSTLLFLLFCTAAAAQGTTTAPSFGPPVLGKPFSIVRHWESHGVLPNGKKQDSHSVMTIYRDSAGRTRTDLRIDDSDLVKTVVIDRAARVEYWWNNKSKICLMRKLGEPTPLLPYRPMDADDVWIHHVGTGEARHKEVSSGLPSRTFEGLEVPGTHTVVYAPGNDTVVTTSDQWYSADLRYPLYMERDEPGRTHQVWLYKDLKREEPKAELFVLPPNGYEVKVADSPDEDKYE